MATPRTERWLPLPPRCAPAQERPGLSAIDPGELVDEAVLVRRHLERVDAGGAAAAQRVVVRETSVSGGLLSGASVDRWQLRDVVADDVDLAGVIADRLAVERVALTGCRLTGAALPAASLRDVDFDDCVADDLSLRFATVRQVRFSGCRLRRLDLIEAELDRVTFENCDLVGARFDGLRLARARFRNCDLAGASGALALRGAEMSFGELVALAPSLAADAGITLVDDEAEA